MVRPKRNKYGLRRYKIQQALIKTAVISLPVLGGLSVPVGVYAANHIAEAPEVNKVDINEFDDQTTIAVLSGVGFEISKDEIEFIDTQNEVVEETVSVEGLDLETTASAEYEVQEEVVEEEIPEETESVEVVEETEPETEAIIENTEVSTETNSGGVYEVDNSQEETAAPANNNTGVNNSHIQTYETYADNGTYVRYARVSGIKPKLAVAGDGCYSKSSVASMVNWRGATVAVNGGLWEGNGHPSGTTYLDGYVWSYIDNHYNNGDNLVMYPDGTLDSVYVDRYNVYDLGIEWSVKGNIVITTNGKRKTEYYSVGRHPYSWIAQDWDGTYTIGSNGGRGYEGCGMSFDEIHNFIMNKVSSNTRFIYVLDGGGSTAYWLNGETLYGWGRSVPNAVYF